MALLDLPYPHQRASYGSGLPSRRSSSATTEDVKAHFLQPPQVTGAATQVPFGGSGGFGGGNGGVGSEMQTSLSGSASSGSLAPPPGLPHSGSTAELVALGLLGSGDSQDDSAGLDRKPYSGELGGYEGRLSIPGSNSSGSMVGSGSTGSGSGGLEAASSGGGVQGSGAGIDAPSRAGTGSAGGLGMELRDHSLTNLANMVRSQSVSSFHSNLFARGAAATTGVSESSTWGSYPANLDKAGGDRAGNAFAMSPGTAPLRGTTTRGSTGIRPTSSGGDVGGAELSPPQFAGRGTAPRREVERGASTWATGMRTSQRRPTTTGGNGGSSFDQRSVPPGPGGGVPTSGRAIVHNRSDTDLVASFSRFGFGQGSVSRWSPLMSPTASPLVGAPLLEEDPLDLELEGSTRNAAGAEAYMVSSSSQPSRGQRSVGAGGGQAHETSLGVRLPRHASYPSLALSRESNGGHGVEELVHGALEHLTVGDSATGGGGGPGGEGTNGNGTGGRGLGASSMGSGSLSGSASNRVSGRLAAAPVSGDGGGGGSGVVSMAGASTGVMNSPAALGGGGYTSSPARSSSTLSPATSTQRTAKGVRHGSHEGGRSSQTPRHRPHTHGGSGSSGGGGGGHDHPNPQLYEQVRGGGMAGGVDGVMMNDGRFVPSSPAMMRDSGMGGHPGIIYPDLATGYGSGGIAGGSGGGFDSMGGSMGGMAAPGGMIDAPWGANQDPVSLYQALLMKQSLAAAHASGMRFPNMMPMTNGMGINVMDMATIAAAAQTAAATGRGPYGGGGGGAGGYPGMDPMAGGYGRRDGGLSQRTGPRAGVAGVDVGYGFPVGAGMSDGRMTMRMGMSRGGGSMYDMVENIGDGNVYQVQFKRSTRNFLLGKACERDLQVIM